MRLIDADALQTLFNDVSTSLLGKAELCKDTEHMVRAFIMTAEMIQDAQTVDAVPVVRCRECIHFDPEDEDGLCCNETKAMLCPDEDDFCSYGQRKDQSADVRKKEGIPDAAKETT